jgi:hypothetical protein
MVPTTLQRSGQPMNIPAAHEPANIVTLERRIDKSEEREYYVEVPFEMPANTERLQIEIDVRTLGGGRAVIDLGLMGPDRIRGWSGGARTQVTIGPEWATPGYLPGELTPGRWCVLLGAYRVPDDGCVVRIHLRFQPEAGRWLKGDLHSHSEHSDGTYTLEEAAAIMEALGCDFLATTDHNTVSQNYAHPKTGGIVFIPGMELTTNYGHANFLGVPDPLLGDFRTFGASDLRKHMQTARSAGAFAVINHPHCDMCPWEWGFDVTYDAVEVWNGPWTERNDRALQWWQEQLAAGRKLVAVGGSDVHKPHPYVRHAMPTTWVFASARSVKGILEGIAKGRVFLSFSPDGPTIDHRIGGAMAGDSFVPGPDGSAVSELRLSRVLAGDRIRIVTDRGVEEERLAQEDGEFVHRWEIRDRKFCRIEVWRRFAEVDRELMAAMSNPIYLEPA